MRSWLNCWKNVEMKSHFWNISPCLETFWCIISSILFNLEALCRPRLRDWMRKYSSVMIRNIAGYLLGEHLSIPNESSLWNIKKCHLLIRPKGILLSERTIWQNVPIKQRDFFPESEYACFLFLKLWLKKWICLLVFKCCMVNRALFSAWSMWPDINCVVFLNNDQIHIVQRKCILVCVYTCMCIC